MTIAERLPEYAGPEHATVSACPACVAAPSAVDIARQAAESGHARLMLSLPTALCMGLDPVAAVLWDWHGFPLSLPATFLLLAVAALLYRVSLTHAGDLLMDRETAVLAAVLRDRGE